MEYLNGRNTGLDAVPDQQDNYRKSGFTKAWNNIRFAGMPEPAAQPSDVDLVDARSLPFDALASYDRRFFPAARDSFLACWMVLPGRRSVAALRGGEIVGLGVTRTCREGSRIGPLYAASPDVAAALITSLAAQSPGNQAVIDVPDINPLSIGLMRQLGLEPQFETARMYTGPVPQLDFAGLYGVTSLELG